MCAQLGFTLLRAAVCQCGEDEPRHAPDILIHGAFHSLYYWCRWPLRDRSDSMPQAINAAFCHAEDADRRLLPHEAGRASVDGQVLQMKILGGGENLTKYRCPMGL
jgi:hypothetical protein